MSFEMENSELGHMMLNPKFFAAQIQIQIPIPNKYFVCGYKGLVFCRNNGRIMENMDKGLI